MVEDVLVRVDAEGKILEPNGLNPCCGGRCSSTKILPRSAMCLWCLNPCCGGRCSSTQKMMVEPMTMSKS